MTEEELYEWWELMRAAHPRLERVELIVNRRLRVRAGRCKSFTGPVEIAGWLLDNATEEEILDVLTREAAHIWHPGQGREWRAKAWELTRMGILSTS